MKYTRYMLILAIALGICSCQSYKLNTPSGRPEVTVKSTNRELIKSTAIGDFMDANFTLVSESDHMLVFSKPMKTGQLILYKSLLGNSYSTDPVWNIRISIAKMNTQTKLKAQVTAKMQNAFGQESVNDMTTGASGSQMQAMLVTIKKKVEGMENSKKLGKLQLKVDDNGLVVVVPEGSSAQRVGIRPDDKIIALDGVNTEGLTAEALIKLTEGVQGTLIEIKFVRNGKAYKCKTKRE